MNKITPAQIRLAFPGCRHVLAPDARYQAPTLVWLRGPFWEWFRKERWAANLDKWTRRNDCDNFARAYAQAAQDCHALTTAGTEEGLAVGEVFYTKAGAGGHAIVTAFVGDAAPIFIEPQNNAVLPLTPDELSSVFFVRF